MHKVFIGLILYILPCILFAQENTADSSHPEWSFSTSGYYYFTPDDENTFTVIGYADHQALHFEARYNYEDLNTTSAFAGWRFDGGKKIRFSAAPMLGLAVGNTDGLVTAFEFDAAYKIFDLYSESEYLFNFASKEDDFFYMWSEAGVNPGDAIRAGISVQRTRLYQTEHDTQSGIFAEYSFWKLTAGVYYFNPFSSGSFVIAALSMDF